jgi:hypothetical protein
MGPVRPEGLKRGPNLTWRYGPALFSASLTPANARFFFKCNGAVGTYCMWKCETELWSTANLWDGTRNHPGSCPPSLQACIATCVAAKKVAQH